MFHAAFRGFQPQLEDDTHAYSNTFKEAFLKNQQQILKSSKLF